MALRHPRVNRGLAVFAVMAGVSAVVAGLMAFTVFRPASRVVLDPEPAALRTGTSVVPAPPRSESAGPTEAPMTTAPGVRVPPSSVTIDDLDISQAIRPVGLEISGAMTVPDAEEIGWYLHGAVPGHPGATVLVAHVWWDDTPGPFHDLGALEPGADVEIRLDDGTTRDYTVVERAVHDKESLPSELWRNSGPETLVLITCGGDFDRSERSFEQNIVVSAVPTETLTLESPFPG